MLKKYQKNVNYFASTRKISSIYKILAGASQKNIEKKLNIKTEILIIKKKFPSIKFLFFFMYWILSGKLFSNEKYIQLQYRGHNLGRFAYATTSINIESSYKVLKSLILKLKYLFLAGAVIDTAYYYSIKICGAYVDHGVYLNGLYIDVFLKNDIRIYSNNYPKGLFTAKLKKRSKINFSYEKLIQIKHKKMNSSQETRVKKIIKKTLADPNFMPWMKMVKFKKQKNIIDYNKFDYIIYAHAFTDAQLIFGYDGYANMRDWLIETINILKKLKKPVIIKPHPNFYDYSLLNLNKKNKEKNISYKDHQMYLKIKNMYNDSKIHFLDEPYFNMEFLNKLNKKKHTIITHHSSAILECCYMGFKCISSKSTVWDEKIKLTNSFSSRIQNKKILSKKFKHLKYSKSIDVLNIFNEIYFNKYGPYGDGYFITLLRQILGVKQVSRFGYDKELNNQIKKSKIKTIKTIDSISKNIEEIIL
jgi:hypothetical protein|tara:strand:- start:6731 stop:8152 length:1422 start_codon:yes stop_codon:yes gene_type:complete